MTEDKQVFDFDHIDVGDTMGPMSLIVTDDLNRSQIVDATSDPAEVAGETRALTNVEPTIFMRNFAGLMRSKWQTTRPMVHANSRIRLFREVQLGAEVTITGQVAEKYVKNGRPYIVIQSETRSGGVLVSQEWNTVIVAFEA